MSATLGLDDSAYRQGIQNVQSETKKTVSSLSGEYSKAAKAVVELTRRYNESVVKTGKASSETKNLKTMLAQAEAQLRATTTALKAANNGMEGFSSSTDKASSKSLAGAIAQGTIMAGVFSKLGSAALSAAEGFIASGIEYNAQIEKYTTGFTNMLGSAEAAQQVMSQIQEDAAKTPFDVESLTKANQYLISAGENASYARNTIMALGDAVSATGGGNDELNRMSQNLQQIANTGKATTADIKQFAYAGIDVYGILADYTGKSTAEVQNMTISYDLLTQALQAASEEGGRYYNSMDTQSQTMNGRVSTLKDNVSQLAGLLTGDLSSGIGVVIGNLNDLIVKAQEAYKTDGWIGLAGAITGLTEPINTAKNAFKDFASKATTWLDQLSYKLNRFLGKAATADFDTYEEYADANNRQRNRNRLRQNALNGVGISNKSWSERQAELAAANGSGGSSIVTTGGGSSGGKKSGSSGSKSTVETVISSISSTATTTAQNALGTVTTSIQTLTEKVKDSSGKIKDRITETTTTTGKEMVNGVATTFKQVETKVNGTVTKVTKTYDDMSKTLLGTLVTTATKLVDGVSTVTQQTTEKYADGSEHIKQIVTETGQHIVNGALETYTRVKTIVDGHETDTKETTEAVVSQYDTLLSAYGSAGKQVQELTALYNESAETTGLDSEQTKRLSTMLADAEEAYASAGKELQEYEKKTDRARVVTKNFADLLKKSNAAFADFGGSISELGEFFGSDSIQGVGEFFTEITDGVDKVINLATSTATLVETLQQLSTTLQSIKAAGGVSTLLSGAGKLLGIGGTAAAGTATAGAAGTAATGAAGSGLAALGISVPEIGMILLAVLGVGAVGYGIYKLVTKNKEKDTVSSAMSYKDLQDAYWYGNERAFAGYDYRTDPYTFNPNNSAVLGYQAKMQEQMAHLTEVVQQYLPDVANQQIVLDDGTLVGKMAPGMNAELGQMQILSERGN